MKVITIEFKDPLAILAQFSCFDVITDASYQDVWSNYFDLLDKEKLFIDFTIDSSVDSLTEKKKLIVVACSYYDDFKKITFYDYMIHILKHYQLELIYDGNKTYTVALNESYKDYNFSLIDYFSIEKINYCSYVPASYSSHLCLPFFNG
ncbi:hypothetical protein, partial [Piscirickettsia litoralis]|uniref:hypothetical protein n=1 Tax=Piscirickettsia litoralis TaxID=1891921 RepID=UPI001301118A